MPEQLTPDAVQTILDTWSRATASLEGESPLVPLKIMLGEAVDLAEVIDQHFHTATVNGKVRLGLDSMVNRGVISAHTSTEIRELQLAIATAQSRHLLLVQQASNAPIEQAESILSELRVVLGFVLEDGNSPAGEEQLSRLRDAYEDANSHDGIALALQSYAELALQHQAELEALASFDMVTVERAAEVAQALRQRSADRLTGKIAQEQRDMMRLRNRLISALKTRMDESRRTIRFLFREYPDIVAKAGSEYARNKKRRARRSTNESEPSASQRGEATLQVVTPNIL